MAAAQRRRGCGLEGADLRRKDREWGAYMNPQVLRRALWASRDAAPR
jgi:hypothetical protein